ncbi:MAG TPA: single-stranded-DNA-specific exonuclease RecJ [Pirellulales bacterium]|jgi:single-stranded-DNA-specific exonuclease|nr:single-stranded-DNA-specific exonuclease RecJ [Pirellulales bacterium]
MAKRWRYRPHDAARVTALEREAGVPAVVAHLLLSRGIDQPQRVRDFLDCKLSHLRDPAELPGAAEAAERLYAAIADRRKIVVYGDYDVDGVTGTSLLWQCLRLLGAEATTYVPHRIEEGYGLNDEALRTLAAQGAKVVVTVDCGIASVAEARTARELGLELIITDHHCLGAQLPEAAAIVHPAVGPAGAPSPLSGAGVAFKLAWALCQRASGAKRVSDRMREFLLDAVALAAIGTVADCVPLIDENRVLVQYGLRALGERPSIGLASLARLAELDRKPELGCEDIAFALAPRINAAGRLGQAQLAVELLTTASAERAAALAEYMNELNASRQSLERSIYLAAHKQIVEQHGPECDAAFVVADYDWHPGVIGIVAGRLAEKLHRPVVLIALDATGVKPGTGSARSIAGFDLHAALAECGEHLLSHGGHAVAAGLRIALENVAAFREQFCEVAAARLSHEQRQAELWIDAEVPLAALTLQTVCDLERLAPFGIGNHRPVFAASAVALAEAPRRIGGGGRHLSLQLSQGPVRLRGVAFGGGDWLDELSASGGTVDIVFRPVINAFRGRRSVELQLTDWRVSEPVVSAT